MKEIGLIINPHSKKVMKMNDPVEYYKAAGGNYVDIRITQDIEDITKAVEDFKKNSIYYVAISGGDGSIHNVISKLIKVYGNKELPHILILKDGSMNNIAKSYKLRGQGTVLLKKLINALDSKKNIKIVYRDTIIVHDMCCFLFGLGFVANYINEFSKGGKKSPLKAIKIMLKALYNALRKKDDDLLRRINLKLVVDGKELPIKEYFAVFASTIKNIALCFNPTPRAYEKEKTFHMIALGLSPLEFFLKLNKIRRGVPIKHSGYYNNIASEIEMIYPGEFLYQMDGDVYSAHDKLVISAGPKVGFVSI